MEKINEYKFQYKNRRYLIRVQPDIVCRGGWNGKGTRTNINPIENVYHNGVYIERVVPECRGYQGRHSKAGIIRVIKAAEWDRK